MDLIDYFNETSSAAGPPLKDKTYDKIISYFSNFIDNLENEDKQLLLKIISKSYYRNQESIKAHEDCDYNLINGMLMSILIDQQKELHKLVQ
ncbi:MAG: hypothetical protein H0X03_01700 [Nitrosopumilus sp.]|nr:hypothetical protein [Nitrosopumilus sp.]